MNGRCCAAYPRRQGLVLTSGLPMQLARTHQSKLPHNNGSVNVRSDSNLTSSPDRD